MSLSTEGCPPTDYLLMTQSRSINATEDPYFFTDGFRKGPALILPHVGIMH